MAYPILAPNSTWYKSSVSRSTITEINIVDSYSGTADETWNADADNSGAVKCYRTGTVLTIAGNGSGKIAMNADSSYLFALTGGGDLFSLLATITGLALLDASGATTLKNAFDRCTKVTALDVGGWDVSNVTNMERTFQGCIAVTSLDLSGWDVSSVTTMFGMFLTTASFGAMALTSVGDLSSWDTSSVENFSAMFQMCQNLISVDISGFNTKSVKTTKWMFTNCWALTSVGDLSSWSTSNITDVSYMFNGCSSLESLNVSGWDVTNITTMRSMFSARNEQYSRYKITGLETWNPSSCTDMGWMFWGCAGIGTIDVSGWDVSKVEIFHHWLCKTSATVIGVENFDVSSCRAFNAMLYGTQNTSYDLSKWDVSNAETLSQMFDGCHNLEEIIGLENWNTSKCRDFREMFYNCYSLRELNLSSFDTRNASAEWTDPWNGQNGGMALMLGNENLRSLRKITLGENFVFAGDGTDTPAVLPTPSADYIDGADGLWYNENGEGFAPADVPDKVNAIYYASPELIETEVIVEYGTMAKIANAARSVTGTSEGVLLSEIPELLRSGAGGPKISDAEGLIAAVTAGGEITLAPDADITVSETLNLPAGTVIHGNGATIRRAAGFEGILFSLNAGCRLENFTVEGNRSAMVSPTWDKTIEISTRANCVIDGITINNANEGIVVYEDDVIVRGCRLYNCGGNGIHMSGADRTRIEDCVIIGANKNASVMGNSNGCIYWCAEANETVVTGCHCEDGLAGFGGIDGIDNCHLKIIGCTVKDCDNAAYGAYKSTGGPIDIVISGNQFIGCGDLRLTDASQKVAPGDGLVISGNLFTDTGIRLQGFRKAAITGNTVRGGWIALYRCPYCAVSNNVVENPGGIGIYFETSANVSVSGNSVRCKNLGIYGEACPGIVIFGNIIRQSPHNVNSNCIQLNSCPEAAIDNNKLFVYYGNGFMAESNCRAMGNFIVVADSSQIAIRVWGGNKNYVVAQNMSNGTLAVATGTNTAIQNNITIESTAFVDVTYTLTNLTTDGFAKALTADDFEFTLTAADGYVLPETITVTMGGTALAAGTGYAYDKATGKVTVYRVSGAVEITAGGAE